MVTQTCTSIGTSSLSTARVGHRAATGCPSSTRKRCLHSALVASRVERSPVRVREQTNAEDRSRLLNTEVGVCSVKSPRAEVADAQAQEVEAQAPRGHRSSCEPRPARCTRKRPTEARKARQRARHSSATIPTITAAALGPAEAYSPEAMPPRMLSPAKESSTAISAAAKSSTVDEATPTRRARNREGAANISRSRPYYTRCQCARVRQYDRGVDLPFWNAPIAAEETVLLRPRD